MEKKELPGLNQTIEHMSNETIQFFTKLRSSLQPKTDQKLRNQHMGGFKALVKQFLTGEKAYLAFRHKLSQNKFWNFCREQYLTLVSVKNANELSIEQLSNIIEIELKSKAWLSEGDRINSPNAPLIAALLEATKKIRIENPKRYLQGLNLVAERVNHINKLNSDFTGDLQQIETLPQHISGSPYSIFRQPKIKRYVIETDKFFADIKCQLIPNETKLSSHQRGIPLIKDILQILEDISFDSYSDSFKQMEGIIEKLKAIYNLEQINNSKIRSLLRQDALSLDFDLSNLPAGAFFLIADILAVKNFKYMLFSDREIDINKVRDSIRLINILFEERDKAIEVCRIFGLQHVFDLFLHEFEEIRLDTINGLNKITQKLTYEQAKLVTIAFPDSKIAQKALSKMRNFLRHGLDKMGRRDIDIEAISTYDLELLLARKLYETEDTNLLKNANRFSQIELARFVAEYKLNKTEQSSRPIIRIGLNSSTLYVPAASSTV